MRKSPFVGLVRFLACALIATNGLLPALAIAGASKPLPRKPVAAPPATVLKGVPTMRAIQGSAAPNTVPGADDALPRLDLGKGARFGTRLDEVAKGTFPPETVAAWKAELRAGRADARRKAELHAWVGESLLAAEEPDRSEFHFRTAQKLQPGTDVAGVASYGLAAARFFEGRYAQAGHLFRALLKSKLPGYSRKNAAMFAKHAQACAGYHAGHAAMGIPQPERLDPLCGASAIGVSLRSLGMPYDKERLEKLVPHTGMGSSFVQLRDGAKALGLTAYAVHAGEKGLRAMPKPVLAHVERDHYVSVVSTDEKGVAYVCSDCGRWPGGEIRVTWKQWRAMEADAYMALAKPGSAEDLAYAALKAGKSARTLGATASLGAPQGTAAATAAARDLLAAMSTNVTAFLVFPPFLFCGQKPDALHCVPGGNCCPEHSVGSLSSYGPSGGDPVNLATGEEEYAPAPDMSVYNPTGPSLAWRRLYNSLGSYTSGFGAGWSHTYNLSVEVSGGDMLLQGQAQDVGETSQDLAGIRPPKSLPLSGFVYFPNGSRVAFTTTATPSAATPQVPCTIPNGYPFLMTADYHAASGTYTFTITREDRSKWTTIPRSEGFPTGARAISDGPPEARLLPIAKLADRVGNWISFTYGAYNTWNNGYLGQIKRLTGIYDSAGTPLLTLGLTSDGYITSANDRYDRSVYYSVGTYGTTNVDSNWQQSFQLLNQVSIIVPTGTVNPLVRYQYGYVQNGTAHFNQTLPFLQTISVPSPTGTGMVTTTMAYDASGYIQSITDANGNKTEFSDTSAGGANETTVKVKDPLGNVVWQQATQFDAQMNETKLINGVGQTVWTKSYSSPQTPFRATTTTDGNSRVWQATYDIYGHLLTSTTPKGTATTNTYDYSNFPLGELVETKTGTQTSTQYTYNQPSGLIATVSSPMPGDVGTGSRQTTSFSWNSVGNLVQISSPGNNAAAARTTTFGYTTDGSYSQPERLLQPITSTDSLGKVTHLRYDARGNLASTADALGHKAQTSYNLADQGVVTTLPATGQTGTGNSTETLVHLYTGGPLVQVNSGDESGAVVRTTAFAYGAEGEALSRTGSAESESRVYNAIYRLKTLRDGNNNPSAYSYDIAGRSTSLVHPLGSGVNYDKVLFTSYDPMGNLLSRTDGNGQITNYAYADTDGKLSAVSYPGKTQFDVSISYDLYDRISVVSDGAGSGSATYDDLGNTISSNRTYTGVPTQTTVYTYWPDGSRHTMANAAGTWTYAYDAVGRYASMVSPAGTSSATYFDNGWQSSRTLPNGATTSYAYNPMGMLSQLINQTSGGATISQYNSLAYDGVFNVTGLTANVPGASPQSGSTGYAYDSKNRLTQEQSQRNGGYTGAFVYDGAGNPTTFKGAAQTFDSDNRQTSGGTFVYDGNGNPTTYKGTGLLFDPENRLASAGAGWSAGYRADNLRAWKQVGPTKTYYLYDRGEPVAELSSSGAVTAVNVFAPDGLVARHQGGSWTYYAFDEKGNVAQRLDSTQTVQSSSIYDAYGIESSVGTPTDTFGYNARWGYVFDRETGLYLCQRRYYDAAAGRWLTRDPIGFAGGIDLYAYCVSRPTRLHDEMGLMPSAECIKSCIDNLIIGAIAGCIGGALTCLIAVAGWAIACMSGPLSCSVAYVAMAGVCGSAPAHCIAGAIAGGIFGLGQCLLDCPGPTPKPAPSPSPCPEPAPTPPAYPHPAPWPVPTPTHPVLPYPSPLPSLGPAMASSGDVALC